MFIKKNLKLLLLAEHLSVVRLEPGEALPDWAMGGEFTSVTFTGEELSIICRTENVPRGVVCETGWRALKVVGPFEFNVTGVAAALATPLAESGIPILLVATYETDYLLVKAEDLDRASAALRKAGHQVN